MRMARRSGGTHKGVEEKRKTIPIYQHYTLSPGKTKSHHPEAKCNHCLKEFVCGSKQRLIRHIRKCNSITNPEQIIAETLNTLARSSATGQLNQSILEASNLLPSQITLIQHSATQQLVGQAIHHPSNQTTTITTANSNINLNNNNGHQNNIINDGNHNNTSGSGLTNDHGIVVATNSSNGSLVLNESIPVKRPQKRGRKPGNLNSNGPGIHVTTGSDGKTHFTPASQLPHPLQGTVTSTPLTTQVHNGRGSSSQLGYNNYQANVVGTSSSTSGATAINASGVSNSGHLSYATSNHHDPHNHHSTPYKLNSEPIDKAYLKLVLTRNLPISLCDTKEFHSWVKTFANDYKPPSSINLIAQNLKREAQLARQKVANILVKAPKKTINLELHCWPDDVRHHHWYAMIAGIDQRRFLVSVRDALHRVSCNNNINISRNGIGNNNNNNSNNNNNNNNPVSHSNGKTFQSDRNLTEFIDDCIKRVGSDRINSLIFSGKDNDDPIALRARQSLYTDHPSIVTYQCWWHFTNLMCSDIIENIEVFQTVLRNSNLLMNYISKRPLLSLSLEKFGPFTGANGSLNLNKEDPRWYSHLVCYLFEYINNNNEAILRAFEAYSSPSSHLSSSSSPSSDSNNNSSNAGNNLPSNLQISSTGTQQQQQQQPSILYQEDIQLLEAKSIIMSAEYWTNLNSAINCLKPIKDLITTSTASTPPGGHNNGSSRLFDYCSQRQQTTTISPIITNNLTLGEFMNWFLAYGRVLFESWQQSPDSFKYQIIGHYLRRLSSSLEDFNLMFAAYLLNPKYRCAYMTQTAKDKAIEEILNVASEFMPEESDGHTIFDQWKLYLGREEPYSMAFDETYTSPLDWWMSVPCAESIRRVALRILRLRAFTSPKPENLFSQLYFYEDETKANLNNSNFEDIAVLRYFYDHEDKIGQQSNPHNSSHNSNNNINSNYLVTLNGFQDRSQIGQIHNDHQHRANSLNKFLPNSPVIPAETNGDGGGGAQKTGATSLLNHENRSNFVDSYSEVADTFINHNGPLEVNPSSGLDKISDLTLESLPGYEQFKTYVDFSETGVQVIEEPIEKKKRKWTAQEIISKCQSSNQTNNNNGSNNNNNNNNNNVNDIDNAKTIKSN